MATAVPSSLKHGPAVHFVCKYTPSRVLSFETFEKVLYYGFYIYMYSYTQNKSISCQDTCNFFKLAETGLKKKQNFKEKGLDIT
jgi:hypothetical protein